jgi:ornithine cyclodeaminase/alanine dehydrogenase
MSAFGTLVIDSLEQEEASPHKMVDPKLVSGDLSGLVTGKLGAAFAPGKRSAFAFRGIAVGDIAVAGLAYERAVAAGKGTAVAG